MSQKKSYMDRENVLSEGFFSKIIDKISGKNKKLKALLMKDRGLQKSIFRVNNSVKDLEDILNSVPGGKEVKFDKFKIGDFIK